MQAPPSFFSLDYEAASHLLVGRWLHSLADDDLYPDYYRLLTAAKAHGNCRFWLLDMRLRSWHSVAFATWFSELLANEVVREVGAPVFVAYVAGEAHRVDIESVATDVTLRQTAQVEFYPYFFSNEAAARDWLLYHQEHPDQEPPIQQIGESPRE
ncbi:hypothetical protein [Hymenobacter bucti]|uniref:STAS/SEC14 domain-containing protein n=1 Tax=Hymenobacter bucti TaxID=1844114 RepID=A0ABW4QUY1_9BACT